MEKRIVRACYRKIGGNVFDPDFPIPMCYIDSQPTDERLSFVIKFAKKHTPKGYKFTGIRVFKAAANISPNKRKGGLKPKHKINNGVVSASRPKCPTK